jgi:hypothetical protein
MSRIANQPCWISTGPSEHGMMTWRRDQIGCRNVINAESLQTPLTTVVLRSIDLQVGNHLGRGSLPLGSLDSRTLLEYAWQRHLTHHALSIMAILCFLVSSRGECQEQSRIFVTIEEPKVQSRLKEWITMKDGNAQGREIGATRAPCVGWETDAGTAFDCRASGFKHNLMLCVTLHRFSYLCFSERRSEAQPKNRNFGFHRLPRPNSKTLSRARVPWPEQPALSDWIGRIRGLPSSKVSVSEVIRRLGALFESGPIQRFLESRIA